MCLSWLCGGTKDNVGNQRARAQPQAQTGDAFSAKIYRKLANDKEVVDSMRELYEVVAKKKNGKNVDEIVRFLKETAEVFPKNAPGYESTARSYFANVADPNNVTCAEFTDATIKIVADKAMADDD